MFTALTVVFFCRSSVGCRLHAVASEWGKARMGIFEKDIRESGLKGWEGVGVGVLCEARGCFYWGLFLKSASIESKMLLTERVWSSLR
jgi:hypothetical protein